MYGLIPANVAAPLTPNAATITGPKRGALQHAAPRAAAITAPMLTDAAPTTLPSPERAPALFLSNILSSLGGLPNATARCQPLRVVRDYRFGDFQQGTHTLVRDTVHNRAPDPLAARVSAPLQASQMIAHPALTYTKPCDECPNCLWSIQ